MCLRGAGFHSIAACQILAVKYHFLDRTSTFSHLSVPLSCPTIYFFHRFPCLLLFPFSDHFFIVPNVSLSVFSLNNFRYSSARRSLSLLQGSGLLSLQQHPAHLTGSTSGSRNITLHCESFQMATVLRKPLQELSTPRALEIHLFQLKKGLSTGSLDGFSPAFGRLLLK